MFGKHNINTPNYEIDMEQQQFVNDNVRSLEETNYNFEEKQYLQNYIYFAYHHDIIIICGLHLQTVIMDNQNVLKIK